MLGDGGVQLLLWVLSTTCLIKVSLELDHVVDNYYLIDCGSMTNRSVGNRVFSADEFDSGILSSPRNISVSTRLKPVSPSPPDVVAPLYQTARIFTGISQYIFSIRKHGWYWIRLHFFPFVDGNYDLYKAKFSVSAQNFSFLGDFKPQNKFSVKEYSLNITSDKLILTFTPSSNSFGFVNALEIISLPEKVIPDGARTINTPAKYQTLSDQALETVARVNMGNQSVSLQNDTLWRQWNPDGTFLNHAYFGKFVSEIGAVNYTGSLSSKEIAPPFVYGTATKLNSENDPSTTANMTWSFPVSPGFKHMVRFHFCDIVSKSPEQLFFNVYINSWLVALNLDLSNLTSNILGTPYYMDVITGSIGAYLSVSIGPSNVGNPYPDGILNGLEIMKVSNSKRSLVDASLGESSKKNWVIVGIVIGLGLLLVSLILGLVLFFMCGKYRKASSVGHSTEETVATDGTAIVSSSKIGYRFSFAAIKDATDGFSESNAIGVGGFGKVYKGLLKDGTKVAVKRGISQSRQGLAEFRTEIEMLSQFRHRHLVSLIGYCHEKDEMIIIYEYMENGALKNHLYGSDLPSLSWRKRLEICIGSARGLHYLHTGSTKPIIHRDVKSTNILLDENFSAKIADFGISKTVPEIDKTHVSTAVKGSFGYLDPEYLTRQQLTEKSDVYSFGVVMLEVLCGRPVINPALPWENANLIQWAMDWEKRGELEKIMDPSLGNQIKADSLRKFGETALKCLAECGIDRPAMGDVLWNLEYALQIQGVEERVDQNEEVDNLNQFETSTVSNTELSMGSIAGVSMSRVFSQMVKADTKWTDC